MKPATTLPGSGGATFARRPRNRPIVVGLIETLETWRGVTERVVVFEIPAEVAVIVTDCVADTSKGVTAKVALVLPAATVTLAGTVAALVAALRSFITSPLPFMVR